MREDPLQALLGILNRGDTATAEAIFLAYEPYLRMVVRRQITPRLRSKFDSTDVVQSVWADLIDAFRDNTRHFEDAARLRAFLVRAARNRLIDRFRQARRALDHEVSLDATTAIEHAPSPAPQPFQEAEAAELWDRMWSLCPPAHRNLLSLRREGLHLDEIASRAGLHESSVRRIFYNLARSLADRARRDDERGTSGAH